MCLWISSQKNLHHHDQNLPTPIDEKLKGVPSLKKILIKKIGKIIKKLHLKLKKLLKKKLKKLFFLPTVSFHVFQHPQASPITWCHPPRVSPVPNFPSFLKCPSNEAASQDLEEHILKNFLHQ